MQCIECQYLNLRKDKTMAEHGFGFCMMTMATFYSMRKDIECRHFVKTDDAKIQKRIDWYDKRS
jgi:hypothetical protein